VAPEKPVINTIRVGIKLTIAIMKKKVKLSELKVNSFVTVEENKASKIGGSATGPIRPTGFTYCIPCEGPFFLPN